MFVHKSLGPLVGGNVCVYLANTDLHENILYISVMQNKIFIDEIEEVPWDVDMLPVKCLHYNFCCIAQILVNCCLAPTLAMNTSAHLKH